MKRPCSRFISGIALGAAGLLALAAPVQASLVSTHNLNIANHSFENGLSGWVASANSDFGSVTSDSRGILSPNAAQDGRRFAAASGGGASMPEGPIRVDLRQYVDVSMFSAAIDTGTVTTSFLGYGYGQDDGDFQDRVRMRIDFLDEGSNRLGYVRSDWVNESSWTELSAVGTVAAGTRQMKISLIAHRSAGTYVDAGFDNVSGSLTGNLNVATTPLPAAAWLFASAVGVLGWVGRRRRTTG